MSILSIVKEPDPILRKKSLRVKKINKEIKKLMKDIEIVMINNS